MTALYEEIRLSLYLKTNVCKERISPFSHYRYSNPKHQHVFVPNTYDLS